MAAANQLRTNRIGVWTGAPDALPASQAQEVAAELDELGYGSLWFGESYGGESLTTAAMLAGATASMVIGTGIANIYARGPMATAAGARTVHALSDGRFILGLGVSHQPLVENDRKMTYGPAIKAMGDYLDGIEQAPYFAANVELPPIVLAALGPRMLSLAGRRTAGALPHLFTAEYTHEARHILGPDPLLAVTQPVVFSESRHESLRRAHQHLSVYTELASYRANLLREGFSEEDLVRGGSDRLAETLVVMGDEQVILRKVSELLDAGADHVCLLVLGREQNEVPLTEWRALAPALGTLAS